MRAALRPRSRPKWKNPPRADPTVFGRGMSPTATTSSWPTIMFVVKERPAAPCRIVRLNMKLESLDRRAASDRSGERVSGRCLCGAVELEIDFPAFWAWHDHSEASRRAHGAA